MQSIFIFMVTLSTFTLVACNEDSERPEIVTKLRALGVEANPQLTTPALLQSPTTISLSTTVMVPSGESIIVENYSDTQARASFVVPVIAIDQSSITYSDFGGFRLANFRSSFSTPTEEIFAKYGGEVMKMRYGFNVKSGNEEEKIVGDVLMLRPGSSELSWSTPTISIESPAPDAAVPQQETELIARVDNPNDESIKVGWYVSSGKIDNRRAATTTWKDMERGAQTILVSVRGKRTRTFSYAIQNINVE